jgi:four helix bundle protein
VSIPNSGFRIPKGGGSMQMFEEMEVWQLARELTKQVYRATNRTPFPKDFRLVGQVRGACCSVMANIAEGTERDGNAELLQFLSIAKGSVAEVKSHLYIAFDQNYITQPELRFLLENATVVARQLGAFIQYIKRSGLKGRKFVPVARAPESGIWNAESQ